MQPISTIQHPRTEIVFMLKLIIFIILGFVIGSAINGVRQGVKFRAFHSPRARRKFNKKHKAAVNRRIKSIHFEDDELDPKWFDR